MSPTQIAPTDDPNLHNGIRVLAQTTPGQSTTLRAVVTENDATQVATLVSSRVYLVKAVSEVVSQARGAPAPVDPADILRADNVVAASRTLRTTDLKRHSLVVQIPTGLRRRDYFLIGAQTYSELCLPGQTAETRVVIGLVRIDLTPGEITFAARCKRPPAPV